MLHRADCLKWLAARRRKSLHAVVTDPPFGMVEYSAKQQAKLKQGLGIWRLPPAYDGRTRSPIPRFTVLKANDHRQLADFYERWAKLLLPTLVPGAHVVIASHPLLSFMVSDAMHNAGFERRGEIIRLVQTLRGGDRPKGAHEEFAEVTVMPRSMWEPWLLFRKHLDGTVQENLRKWGTGGLRRQSAEKPFGDVIRSRPTLPLERNLAPHPSLKPQKFLRAVVRAVLPLGRGTILDPFAGSGSTIAAAEAEGLRAVGVEISTAYFNLAKRAIPKLAGLDVNGLTNGRHLPRAIRKP